MSRIPKITVFTPTFNRSHTIHRVWDSIKSQTFRDIEWLIIDDGSTDDTAQKILKYQEESDIPIRYCKQENKHKFYTFFKGVELAKGEFFVSCDSDDAFTPDALEKMLSFWEESPENTIFVSVLCQNQFGNIEGDYFPSDGMQMSIFEMRYLYQTKGDKWGITKTDTYKRLKINLDQLDNKGFIPEGVYQYHLDELGMHYCKNEPLLIYYRDFSDNVSLANSYYKDNNAFGLAENFKTFINVYASKKTQFPKVLLRNLAGYLIFAAKDNRSYSQVIKEVKAPFFKLLSSLLYLGKPFLKKVNLKSLS